MQRTELRDLTSQSLSAVIDALPEPAFVVDSEARIAIANAAALALTPTMRLGEHLSRGLRSPDMLDAVTRVLAGGEAEKTVWDERAPVERWFEAHVPERGLGEAINDRLRRASAPKLD